MRTRSARLWAHSVCVAVLCGVAGCGGGSSSDQVRASYSHALSALGRGDYRTFCGLVSDAYRAKLLAAARTGSSVSSCANVFAQAVSSGSLTRAQLKADVPLANQITAVRVSGHTARITLAKRVGHVTVTVEVTAVLEHGGWRIDSSTAERAGGDIVYRVPSGSMQPTLRIGQRVLVDPTSYQTLRPAIGDIVVFHPPAGADGVGQGVCGDPNEGAGHAQPCGVPTPQESTQTFIKRVVAGPGDTIQIINGHVIRNGAPEKDAYIEPCGGIPFCTFGNAVKIPPGDYFVLGDNRGGSDDSRFWGPVRADWIVGKVVGKLS